MTTAVKKAVDSHIERAVAEFKKSDIVIAALATNYMPLKINGVDDKKGYIAVREARLEVKGLRVKVEHKRKELKEDALKYGKAVDAEANRLKALIEPIEEHLQKQEDDYEAAKEKIKAEKAAAVEAALQKRIDRLTAARCPIGDIAFLRDIDNQNFELFFTKAVEVQEEKERLAQVEADRIAAEQAVFQAEQIRIEAFAKAERERVAAEQQAELLRQQEANRVEAERLNAEREAILHNQALQRAAMETERLELKRLADELRAKQEAERLRVEAERKAENDRLAVIALAEAEQAEADRLEALKPEIEKARKLHDAVDLCARSYLDRIGNPSWSAAAMREIDAACNQIKLIVANS